ncbi:MAG: hypothetical protein N2B06_11535 [Clostridium sp.]|jgi:hypothetical protein|tara:strand:- start:332 stop:1498 length:1167 start_codon:yes stop_codon:yes gene_type:complete
MSETVKQEGDFKIKSKKPKKYSNDASVTKVELAAPKEAEVTKVEVPSTVVVEKEPVVVTGAVEVAEENKEPVSVESNKVVEDLGVVIEEITKEEVAVIKEVEKEVKEAIRDERVLGKPLPENIEKLVAFMEETGGNISDYARLNADYSNIDEKTLLREYYKKTKPYLEHDDVDLLMEDYLYDEELDEDRDIRKKKLAFKEEINKARNFLEETKSKYYDEIKLRPGVTQEQQKATDFFNRHKQEEQSATQSRDEFINGTENYFSENFKGFDFNLGEKAFRYGIKNPNDVKDNQKDLQTVVGKFLNKDGKVENFAEYHKAMYAARNPDALATHFYEQGKADAIRGITAKSNNVTTEVRQTTPGDVFVNGFKVRAISGADSSKLRIKKRNF